MQLRLHQQLRDAIAAAIAVVTAAIDLLQLVLSVFFCAPESHFLSEEVAPALVFQDKVGGIPYTIGKLKTKK